MHTTGKTKVLFASEVHVHVRYIFLSYDILTTGRYSQIADEIADIILVKGASLRLLSGDRIDQPYIPCGVHPKTNVQNSQVARTTALRLSYEWQYTRRRPSSALQPSNDAGIL